MLREKSVTILGLTPFRLGAPGFEAVLSSCGLETLSVFEIRPVLSAVLSRTSRPVADALTNGKAEAIFFWSE